MKHHHTAVIAVLLVMSGVAAVAEDEPAVKVTRLTDNLQMLTTDQGAYTTNSVAFVGDEGVLLVDSQAANDAPDLKKVVDAFGKGAPRYIINTHRHVEHVGGNDIFGDAPIVIAHDLVPTKLRSGSYIFDEFSDATFPDITFSDSLTLHFNGEEIRLYAFGGSHDDNEIIVHFTGSGVVHLSSVVNGFNFPSVDSDGDPLKFADLVARAIELLPEDVIIVSGHNDVGTWQDLHAYQEMLVGTAAVVREGLAAGKDLATLQKEKVLAEWEHYAGSYVSVDRWTEYLVERLQRTEEPGESLFEPLYHAWKDDGARAAVELYFTLKRESPEEYEFDELVLLLIGDKLLKKGEPGAAAEFLKASLKDYPESKYAYYINYELADANNKLGNRDEASAYCATALELNPEFEPATRLCGELKNN
jgi:glyoxylase-like metal-dependent hydrolase (beta-lactamase superfamily II)